ncbi:MAG: ImmA/IrrE family metallo-endopeptidase, partial [Tissierellia bacterium]|nr:ImmA/IrrE family metallo-endopeptidase [Tissierellia bacterium]
MTKGTRVVVKREIYEWAIKESQKDFEEIKAKFNKIEDWIVQNSHPTFRQLEKLANYLKVPFGYMFLDKPPKTNVIDAEFRRIGDKIPNMSKSLKDTIYDMSRKQNWISEYRKVNGWNKVIPDSFSDLDKSDYFEFAKKAKDFLDLDEYWYNDFKDNRIAYNFLRDKIENKGMLVMQSGIVGTNTHRKLDINEFRGFMLYDDLAPLIFINTNDSQAGKIFTLIHEYIHILLREDDVFFDADLDNKLEKEVNSITAEFLMPKSHIETLWDEDDKSLNQIEKISKVFNVSKLSLAIRLRELGLI